MVEAAQRTEHDGDWLGGANPGFMRCVAGRADLGESLSWRVRRCCPNASTVHGSAGVDSCEKVSIMKRDTLLGQVIATWFPGRHDSDRSGNIVGRMTLS